MKNQKMAIALVLISVIAFSTCTQQGGKKINSADELKAYLDSQPANGHDKPIKISMKVNEQMIKNIGKVISDAGKYVSLDLTGSPLTTIPDYAFYDKPAKKGCVTLISIIIPEGVISIGDVAFSYCTNLASVTIPKSVTSIGEAAFGFCTNLASVTIPESVTSIGEGAFIETGLTSVIIPNSITSIGKGTFFKCTNLASVTIPDSVTSIEGEWEGGAFWSCTGLTSVTIGNGVTSIGEWTFNGCTSLASVTIPNNVTSIGNGAFRACDSLTSVTFQGTIPSKAFHVRAFLGSDLRAVFYSKDAANGTPGTYTRESDGKKCSKQQ